jgi:hypothetical protein
MIPIASQIIDSDSVPKLLHMHLNSLCNVEKGISEDVGKKD